MSAEPGFVARDALTFRVALPPTTYPCRWKSHPAARRSAGRIARGRSRRRDHRPAGGAGSFGARVRDRGTSGPGRTAATAHSVFWTVTPGYFKALQTLLRGSDFDSGDLRDGDHGVVNKTAAAQFWPGQDAIGKIRGVGSAAESRPWSTVKGVVADVRQAGLRSGQALVYFPINPAGDRGRAR